MNIIETIEVTQKGFDKSWFIAYLVVFAAIMYIWMLYMYHKADKKGLIFSRHLKDLIVPLVVVVVFPIVGFHLPIVDVPTGETTYHVQLTDMTSEELAQRYDIVTYENDYWVIQDKADKR